MIGMLLGSLLLIGLLLFFRDPERTPPANPLALISPADGKVICVDEAEDPSFGLGKFRRVGIFLSVLDVHVNRSPFSGTIEKTHYSAGEFLDARHLEVDIRNENQPGFSEPPMAPSSCDRSPALLPGGLWAGRNSEIPSPPESESA